MIKDIIENFVKEMRNEKNQKHLNFVLEPIINKIKFYYYVIVVLMFMILLNLFYLSVTIGITGLRN